MSDSPIRVDRAADPERFLATDQTVWFAEVSTASTEALLTGLPVGQRFAADVDGADPTTYPGVYGVYPLTLMAPGPDGGLRPTPCAGLTWVGVHPDHRRRGVLSAMMRHHLEQVHAEPGTHVSALHASEPAIYGRYGYGLASLELKVVLSRGTTLTAPELDAAAAAVTLRTATISDPGMAHRMHECHRASAELGAVVGAAEYYDRICLQLPEHQRGKEPWRVLLASRDGTDVGFTMFRRTHKWEQDRPAGEVEVWTVQGDAATRLALLRRLVDLDLTGSVRLTGVGVDDPLLLWAGGPRAVASVATLDSLWVRLVDLPEALADRAWSAPCDVVIDVVDHWAPWNEGRWRLHADAAGCAEVERTDAEADLRLPIEALGAAYLGAGNVHALARAGLVAEHRPGAARDLWRALRTDVAPTGAVGF